MTKHGDFPAFFVCLPGRVLSPTGSAKRPRLYKCGADCAKRCDENEEICNKRLGGGPRLTVDGFHSHGSPMT